MVLVLPGVVRHRGVRVCTHRIGHGVRCDRKCVRMQSGRRVGASVRHQWTRLRRAPLFTRCDGLVHAGHYSRRSDCICLLADFSHSPSHRVAEACVGRNPSSDSLATRGSIVLRQGHRAAMSPETFRGSAASLPHAANSVRLAIAALAAIACLAIIHRAILAGRLARGLVCCERAGANDCS